MRVVLKGIFLILSVAAFAVAGCGDDTGTKTEVCDGRDNDGNNQIDDGIQPRSCQTDCGHGVETCTNGQWVCDAPQPKAEECNALDDDCDGCWDEKAGAAGCEPLEQACSTDCGNGTEQCFMGEWRGCTAPQPQNETCNNIDDDCDGDTDEGLNIDSDNDGHFSLDSCAAPHDDCNDSNREVHPGHEESPGFCDGLDNDCDREIDEGCQCSPGPPPQTQPCSTDIGECVQGNQTCLANGTWGQCDGVLPAAEECNNQDDDCDGTTDNVATPPACELTTGVCTGAVRTGCEPCDYSDDYEYNNEQTCDGLDNDCDGDTDEGLPGDSFENNESCDLARALLSNVVEAFGPVTVDKNLYRTDQTQDVDWFKVTAEEISHICLPGDDQCYWFDAKLFLPQGAAETQWQMCLLDGTGCACSDFEEAASEGTCWWCTDASNWNATGGYYQFVLRWGGLCSPIGGDDSRDFYIVVRSTAGNTVTECENYHLQMEMTGQQNACP
jgi:hypothetical protein